MKVGNQSVRIVESKRTMRRSLWAAPLLFLVMGCGTLPTPPYRQAAVSDIQVKPEVTMIQEEAPVKKLSQKEINSAPAIRQVVVEEPRVADSPLEKEPERAMNAIAMTVGLGFLAILFLGAGVGTVLHKIGKSYPTVEEIEPETGQAETLVIVDDKIKSQ